MEPLAERSQACEPSGTEAGTSCPFDPSGRALDAYPVTRESLRVLANIERYYGYVQDRYGTPTHLRMSMTAYKALRDDLVQLRWLVSLDWGFDPPAATPVRPPSSRLHRAEIVIDVCETECCQFVYFENRERGWYYPAPWDVEVPDEGSSPGV